MIKEFIKVNGSNHFLLLLSLAIIGTEAYLLNKLFKGSAFSQIMLGVFFLFLLYYIYIFHKDWNELKEILSRGELNV